MAEEHGAEAHRIWTKEQQDKQVAAANAKLAEKPKTYPMVRKDGKAVEVSVPENESKSDQLTETKAEAPALTKTGKDGNWHKQRQERHKALADKHTSDSRWLEATGGEKQIDGDDEGAEDDYMEAERHDNMALKHQKVADLHGKLANKLGFTPAKQPIPTSHVGVDTREHTRSHLKEPKGRGGWMFSKDKGIDFATAKQGEDYITTPSMTYADARKHAIKWAASKGHSVIHVMP
jgi:hypothetical protein